MKFFLMQAMGIAMEDTVGWCWEQLLGNRKVEEKSESGRKKMYDRRVNGWVRKGAGYLWVLLWLVWTTPGWVYPSLEMNRGEEKDMVVPFSIIAKIRQV